MTDMMLSRSMYACVCIFWRIVALVKRQTAWVVGTRLPGEGEATVVEK